MDARDEQALTAVKLYYEEGLSQAEVAQEMGVSRPTASKLIHHGKQRGFVTIHIHDPRKTGSELAKKIIARYGLQDVRLAQLPRETHSDLLRELGRAGADLLSEHIRDDMKVGVSWGNTMFAVAQHLPVTDVHGVEIVQLKGGTSHSQYSTNDIGTINKFCSAFHAQARTLPLPVIFDNAEAKRIVEQDRHIAHILQLGRLTDVVIFTVGEVHPKSLLLNLGYLTQEEIDLLVERAAGDACSRFFTKEGEIALPSVDERTVGITLEDLAARPMRILVAGGTEKVTAIHTALTMGLATHLVIDQGTAQRILDLG
ncbi:sugar-binding transcriptional regulator [Corynebacterium freiburgense]|uniref:sugar-binding transcriptional regulator n=1 Tax=Corynebacterium freiburgense TaxID=556548 RepID=UPI000401F36B|nr:sugar-binding transcriptional regulator [Corynebacterium freiburgense]WJZ03337.1 Deoxyribonucleoside regulator [Corynebacterium freiburgense]